MSNPRNETSKRIVRTLSRAVDNMALLTLLVCLVFSIYSFWDTHQVNEAADSKKYATFKPTTEEGKKSFAELQAMNSDVMGWLTIYGTSIDYPLVKAQKDNFTYLSKNAEGEWESSGSIYVDYRNDAHFQDFNTIIHGHHMAEHKMFGDLDLFVKADYFNDHRYANLYFDGANHGLEIFAAMTIDAYHPIASTPKITDSAAQQDYLNSILNEAVQKRDVGVTTNDHLIVMTTCNLNETNGRYTLVAKLLDHEVANPFPEEEEEVRTGARLDVFSLFNNFSKRPLWQWILILIAIVLLLWLLYKAERRRLLKKKIRKQEKEKAAKEAANAEAKDKKEKRLANENSKARPHIHNQENE